MTFSCCLNSTVLNFKADLLLRNHRTFGMSLVIDSQPLLIVVFERYTINLIILACHCLVCKLTTPDCRFDQHK